ncbi:dnaJ homolog subfamily C member 16-like [Macrosteles quadrilineatus]|uniref:dnaJ homolog subfamily C member 16-like n=1 Tax=Macrosteles quadrilineatus TaxID=74068 RepID=UPI0023E1B0FC|nr:dnaJ homolog subfamily C member 16-like [Macrosteles quadrilineatus]XP_054286634.1 dnaJ homolog subfamily C member 16-like [Macrosteles quadrilineatus]
MKRKSFHCLLSIIALGFSIDLCNSLDDPYKTLGIPKSSTVPEIKKAYKQLAKEWHPDKNDDPSAEDKFVEITQAYELLTDPERRKQFDTFGRMEEPRPRHEYRRYDPVDDLFAGTGFRFQYSDRDITLFHKLSITTRAFENMLVPKSYRTPYLILFYSDWCFACLQVEPVWRRIMEELEPIGVGIATAHAENEPMLARRVSIHSLPCLIILVDGKPIVYKESLFSVQKVVEFVRNKLPYRLIQSVTDDGLDEFLAGWVDNKVRALVFQRQGPVRLRYLLTAFAYRDRVAFAFVQTNTAKGEAVRARLQVPPDMDSLLLFNENTERPVASVSMINIPVQTLQDVINSNKYLLLPRLSSQELLDALCPASPRKRLCVLLVSQNTPHHEPHRQSLRRFAQEANYADKVCFMYIFQERQVEFVHALLSGESSPGQPLVAILWRRDQKHIRYEWLPEGQDWASYNTTKQHLEPAIERLLRATQAMTHEAVIGELIDEQAQGIISKVITKLLITYDILRDNLDKEHILPVVSVIATVVVILAAGYLMAYLMKLEETRVQEEFASKPRKGKTAVYQPSLKLHELRAETYNGLVRLLRPGCRTILLLLDTQSRPVLLPKFHKHVWPYRKNKTLMFAHLNLDRGLSWYKELLQLSLAESRDQPLNVNPRNCIGTVLSLNGLRKYFCMYHAKHPECLGTKGTRRMKRMTKQLSVDPAGSFMGFDETDSEESDLSDVEQGLKPITQNGDKYSHVIFQENLLDGLPNWLDRLFEGTTHRYYINYWPDFNAK